ncbi:hypothetical protein COCCU_06255 [Corynebacterium occultum]|uniref:Wadjet protein JetD C-terminal domain-containing protein n=1 Tax=Corynebacterium occultum TaxID=2675219 RepID=A0A6B8VSQ8_9CORY|nr:Wadjet anti-phage system protein JetD domain-containing protein [Corynebacterium occultum]QGU07193.1 hypothetical protein COCCU_06255 [Corynebacterium occultum]
MKYQEDVRSQAEVFYRNNYRTWLRGEFSPRAIGLQPPTAKDVAVDGGRAVRNWLAHWDGYPGMVDTVCKRIGHLGTYEVPAKVVFNTPAAAATAAGRADEWMRLLEVLDLLVDALGDQVRAPLAANPQSWAQWNDREISQYIAVIRWLREHDSAGYYIRELPIRGVDTKWIETHRVAVNSVYPLQGFREKPVLVEVRTLDPALPVGDFSHVLCRVEELSPRHVAADNVIIMENHHSFLALPPIKGTWVLFGGGYRADTLVTELGWLADKNVYYWGDLDSHGFNMVSKTRAVLPAMRTVLMDLDTAIRHEELAVEESTALPYDPANLAPGEKQTLSYLRERSRGRCLRIEQERIDFQWVCAQLESHVGHR